MATYTPVDRRIPSGNRRALISLVGAGDEIDFREVLGRPAYGMTITAASSTDVEEYRLISYFEKKVHSSPDIHRNQIFDVFGVKAPQWTVTEEKVYTDPLINIGSVLTIDTGALIEGVVVDVLTGPATVEIIVW